MYYFNYFQCIRIFTCLIRNVGHVGGVVFDCFFIVFQRCFKVFILICSIAKLFLLQGLKKQRRGLTKLRQAIHPKNCGKSIKTKKKLSNLSLVFWKVFLFWWRWLSLFGFGWRFGGGLLLFLHLREIQSQEHRECCHYSGILQLPAKQSNISIS